MEKEKEKESSRRSWPWKKKSPSEKLATNASVVSAGTSPNSSSLFEEQQPQQQQVQPISKFLAADEAIQQQQSEDKAKGVSEQLATALADITIKDNLVKQHIKVAEEAVSGWEKAEAEAVALKLQLDAALQQKLATEDRVAHLDGALKECMKQLRHVREEQEQLIHDTLVKKTREYDKLRVEMETKLAEASQILSQTRTELLESRAEGKALSHALQERSRSLAELGESKGRAEVDIKILQVRLEAMEKENTNLKYKVHVLNKELEIRNEEREYECKAADIAAKQHLESVKKITKLEEECNRLRVLIRKKLPGPAALQRMRHEVEGLGKVDAIESKRRRSLGHSGRHMDPSLMGMMQENVHDDLGYNGMSSGIAEKMAAMDEEMKMLKEALARRNEELQNAHVTCVKTANRLSFVEEELDRALGVQRQSKQQEIKTLIKGGSHHHHHHHSTDMDINGDASSDAWASALVAELDQFKKKSKVLPLSNGHTDKGQASLSYGLMDDFVEMERLAKMSEPAKSEITYSDSASFDGPRESPLTAAASDQIQELEGELASTRRELESANHTICGLNAKLATAEEQLTALQSRNSANEVLLINLQDQLDRLNEIQSDMERGGDGPPALSDQMSGFSIKDILARGRENGQTGSVSETCSSEVEAPEEHDASVSDAESKASTAHIELAASLLKIVGILEALAQATGSEHTLLVTMHIDGTGKMLGSHLQGERGAQIARSMQWKDLELENAMQILVVVGNKLLQGKCDMVEFISELASALDRIILLKPFEIRSSHQATECDEEDDDDSELLAQQQYAKAQATATIMNLNELKCAPLILPNGEINAADQRSPVKEELPPRPSNQFLGAVASTTEVEEHLRGGNAEIENHLNVVNEKMEQLKVQEEEEERLLLLFDHEMHQDDTQEDSEGLKEDELLEEELMVLSSVNPRVVSSLQAATGEMNHLHDKVAALEVQLRDERQQHQEVMAKLENLQHQLHLNGDWTSHSTSQDEDTKSRKEREDREMAAAALAECQRTIQALGKQLQVMGTVPPLATTTQERTETSVDSSTDSVTSIKKPSTNMEFQQWQTNAAEVIPCLPDIADAHNHSPSALRERSSSSPWVVTNTMEPPPHPGGGKLSPIPTPPGRQYKGRPASADQSFYGWHQGGENGHRFGNDYTDSVGTVPPSPPALSELSGHGSMSMPASPARSPGSVLRSLRKRSSNGPKSLSEDSVAADETPPQKPRTSSTFSRFYSRSRSGSSGSSG
ncbi:unnamed protein product [Sphagnum troendelagicum]|uniref:Uncharacterized protein n=1 Tax=Sphagnum troendelagicum TaxID=128251 RepID=A0ABP0UZJ1_9BRYO